MAQRTILALTDEALQVIKANATERKRGEFVSTIIMDYARNTSAVTEIDDNSDGILERIDNRLAKLEKQMAILLNKLED